MSDKLFAKLDIGFADHAKIIGLSDTAFRAFVEALLYARQQLTDGFLDERVVNRRWGTDVIDELTTNDVVNPSWVRVDGGFQIHDYDKNQMTNADIAVKKAAGRAGGLAKAQRNANKVLAGARNVPEQNASEILLDKIREDKNIKPLSNSEELNASKSEYSDDFETWWKSYPRRQAKGDAWKAWKSLSRVLPSVDILVDASIAYGKTITDPQFLKMPGPWLRARRWEDVELQKVETVINSNIPNWDKPAPEGKKWWNDDLD